MRITIETDAEHERDLVIILAGHIREAIDRWESRAVANAAPLVMRPRDDTEWFPPGPPDASEDD